MRAPMSREAATRLSVVVVTYNSRAAVAASLPALRAQLGAGRRARRRRQRVERRHARASSRELAPGARSSCETGATPASRPARTPAPARRRATCSCSSTPTRRRRPGFVEAIRAPRAASWTAWMGLVTADGGRVVNTSGGVVHFTGIAWAGPGAPPAAGPREVAFLSGACLAVPRARVGAASAASRRTFFMYHEDVDLSLRLRLARRPRSASSPRAVVDHDYEFAKGAGEVAAARAQPLGDDRCAATRAALLAAARARAAGDRARAARRRRRRRLAAAEAGGDRARRCARCRGCCASGARSRRRARSPPPSSRPGSRRTSTRRSSAAPAARAAPLRPARLLARRAAALADPRRARAMPRASSSGAPTVARSAEHEVDDRRHPAGAEQRRAVGDVGQQRDAATRSPVRRSNARSFVDRLAVDASRVDRGDAIPGWPITATAGRPR